MGETTVKLKTIELDGNSLTRHDIQRIVDGEATVSISDNSWKRVRESRKRIEKD